MESHHTEVEVGVISFRGIADKDLPYLNQAPRGLTETEAKLWLAFQHGYGRHKEADVFVPPVGQLQGETQLTTNLSDSLQTQLNDAEVPNLSWLLLADAGMGKTMLGKQLTRQLWEYYANARDQGKTARLPIFIHLSQIPKEKLKQKLLETALSEQMEFITPSRAEGIKLSKDEIIEIKKLPLVLILDGYDEISDRDNLFQTNSWQDPNKHYNIRVVYTCRPEALVYEDKQKLFSVAQNDKAHRNKNVLIYQLQPFTALQIEAYLKGYVAQNREALEVSWQDWTHYQSWLKKLPGLSEMVETPLLLDLITRILPTMVAKARSTLNEHKGEISQAHFTRWYIYETFVEYWILLQARRIESNKNLDQGGVLYGLRGDLAGYLYSYVSNLASYLWRSADGRLRTELLSDNETLRAELLEPRRVKSVNATKTEQKEEREKYEELLKKYHEIVDKSHYSDKSFFAGEIEYLKNRWTKVKSQEEQRQLRTQRLAIIRSGALMKVIQGQYQFIHKTIIEYLTMERMTYNLHNELQQYLQHAASNAEDDELNQSLSQFNYKPIREEPNMVVLLVQQFKEDQNFIRMLSELIMASATVKGLATASSNAATILIKINPDCFVESDLREVQIPEADLRNSFCMYTDFRGADLTNVWFNNANLMFADLAGSNITAVQWGEDLTVTHPKTITCIAHYQPAEQQQTDEKGGGYWFAGCKDGYVYQWRASTGDSAGHYNHGYRKIGLQSSVKSIAIHNQTKQLATGGSDKLIILWDLATGKKIIVLKGHTASVRNLSWHPQGELIASGSSDRTVRLWNVKGECLKVLSKLKSTVLSVSWHSQGELLAYTDGMTTSIWNCKNETLDNVPIEDTTEVRSLSWHPREMMLALVICKYESKLRSAVPLSNQNQLPLLSMSVLIWTLHNRFPGATLYTGADHLCHFGVDDVFSMAWHPKSALLAHAKGSYLWKGVNKLLKPCWKTYSQPIREILWHSTDESLALRCSDNILRIVPVDESLVEEVPRRNKLSQGLSWHSNGELLFSWTCDQNFFDIRFLGKNGVSLGVFNLEISGVVDVSCHPDGELLATGHFDNSLRLWSISGDCVRVINKHKGYVTSVSWNPNGQELASGSEDGYIRMWGVNGETLMKRRPVVPEGSSTYYPVTIVSWHPDGDGWLLVWASHNVMWLDNGHYLQQFVHPSPVLSLASHPLGLLLATGDKQQIYLWRKDGERVGAFGSENDAKIESLSWNPNGKLLASMDDDSVKLWDPYKGIILQTLRTHGVNKRVLFHPTNDYLAVVTSDGVYIYRNNFLMKTSLDRNEAYAANYELYWCREDDPRLRLNHTNFNRTIETRKAVRDFLIDKTGTTPTSVNTYQPYHELFIPIANTANVGLQKSLVSVPGCELSLSDCVWVVTVARQIQKNEAIESRRFFSPLRSRVDATQHVFLILEGILNYRRFIIRADLYAQSNNKEVCIRLRSFVDEAEDEKYNIVNFKAQSKTYEAQQWQVTSQIGRQLIDNIREDQRRSILYDLRGDGNDKDYSNDNVEQKDKKEQHNCVSWCRKQLQLINIEIQSSYHLFGFTLPGDVTKQLKKPGQKGKDLISNRAGDINLLEVQAEDSLKSPPLPNDNNAREIDNEEEPKNNRASQNKSDKKKVLTQINSTSSQSFFPRARAFQAELKPELIAQSSLEFIRSLVDDRRLINEGQWAISLVKSKGKEHVFLLLEGKVKNEKGQDEFLIFRTDLFLNLDVQRSIAGIEIGRENFINKILNYSALTGQAFIKVSQLNVANVQMMKKELEQSDYQGWLITPEQAEILLRAIHSESQKKYGYHIGGDNSSYAASTSNPNTHNCVSWCETVLKTIEIDIGKESWHPIKIPSSRIALARQFEETRQGMNASENGKGI